ncbi:TetR/AcrR family transcriptional regulator C-terminal domain-containing protein [Rhizobium sullae]|uniref:TetR/AcrR family transcriptional regulator C-terminal domain-containing protein n=1 Tax=Rhizobium sullae TaxID=50338 RepID=UPI000B357405
MRLQEDSPIVSGDAGSLARQFHGMILTELQMGRLLFNQPMPTDAQLSKHVDNAIDILMFGIEKVK